LALLPPDGFEAAPESLDFPSFDDDAGAASPDPAEPPRLPPLAPLELDERESVL
jgi:hypothetical protein